MSRKRNSGRSLKARPVGGAVGRFDLDHAARKDLLLKKLVAPAVQRESVAHLRQAHESMSERLACRVIGWRADDPPFVDSPDLTMWVCASGCGCSPRNGGGSAVAGVLFAARRLASKPQAGCFVFVGKNS